MENETVEKIGPTFAEQVAEAMAPLEGVAKDMDRAAAREKSTPATGSIELLDVSLLRESATNPRKRWGDLDDLTASIRVSGIMSPLIVRPNGSTGDYEIVCGSRRFRAGKQAGVVAFPCDVRLLSDDHVLEFQIIENLQRKDLHPMEEAEGYEQMRAAGYEVPLIAARVGKSTGWVYSRLKLLDLTPESRAAFFEHRIELSVAQVLGRQPHANQGKALLGLERIPTVREQIAYLQNTFAKNLKGSPFDLKDPTLPRLGGFGDCASCPSNSNNAPRELFVDYEKIERAGICSNTECYAGKCAAIVERHAEKARARGEAVLSLAQTKKVISYGSPVYGSPYVNSRDIVADDPKRRTWEQIFSELDQSDRPSVTLAPNDQKLGEVFHLYDRKEAMQAAADLGMKWAKKKTPAHEPGMHSDAAKAKRKAADDKARLISETVDQAMAQLIPKWRKGLALLELQVAAYQALDCMNSAEAAVVCAAFSEDIQAPKFEKWIDAATVKELILFVVASTLYPRFQSGGEELSGELKACARAAGVDLVAIGRAQLAGVAGVLKWKAIDGGAEATAGDRAYSITYDGGAFHWSLEVRGKRGAGGPCKTLAAGKILCADLEAKAVRS